MTKQVDLYYPTAELQSGIGAIRIFSVAATHGKAGRAQMVAAILETLQDLGIEPSEENGRLWAGRGSDRGWDACVLGTLGAPRIQPN